LWNDKAAIPRAVALTRSILRAVALTRSMTRSIALSQCMLTFSSRRRLLAAGEKPAAF